MEKKVEFKSADRKYGGKLFIPKGKGPFPGVIFFHGSGGTGETHFETAKMLSEHGFLGFAFNYQGVGLSGGRFEEQTITYGIADGVATGTYFTFEPLLDKGKLGFVGGSFGGFIAATISDLFDIRSMVLVSPAAYSDESWENQRDADRDLDKKFEESLSYKKIRKYKGELLVQICEFDDVLPKGMAEKYYYDAKNAGRKELYIIKGARHRLSIQPKQKKDSQDKIIDWFLKTL